MCYNKYIIRKEIKTMRTIIYGLFEKETNKKIDWSMDRRRMEKLMAEMGEGYEIRHTWRSF
jgi:hypothetical protein